MGRATGIDRRVRGPASAGRPERRDELVDAAVGAVHALVAFEESDSDPLVRSLVRQLRQRLERALALTEERVTGSG